MEQESHAQERQMKPEVSSLTIFRSFANIIKRSIDSAEKFNFVTFFTLFA